MERSISSKKSFSVISTKIGSCSAAAVDDEDDARGASTSPLPSVVGVVLCWLSSIGDVTGTFSSIAPPVGSNDSDGGTNRLSASRTCCVLVSSPRNLIIVLSLSYATMVVTGHSGWFEMARAYDSPNFILLYFVRAFVSSAR